MPDTPGAVNHLENRAAERARGRLWIVGVLALGVFGVLLFALPWLLRPSATEVQQRAEPIITALQGYYDAHGSYPAQLADLVPQQLDKIPATGLSRPFFYTLCPDGEAYKLEFTRQPSPMQYQYYGYTNTLPRWLCSAGIPVFYLSSPCGTRQPRPPQPPFVCE